MFTTTARLGVPLTRGQIRHAINQSAQLADLTRRERRQLLNLLEVCSRSFGEDATLAMAGQDDSDVDELGDDDIADEDISDDEDLGDDIDEDADDDLDGDDPTDERGDDFVAAGVSEDAAN